MEGSLQLLQTLLASNNEKYIRGIVNFCSENKVFSNDKNKAQEVAAFINSQIPKIESYQGTLLILQGFISQCPRDILSSNIVSWVQFCTKTLINTEDGSISTISFTLLRELIRLSANFSEARKEIALSVIPKSLDHFIREGKNQKQDAHVVLQCLEQTLNSYGKSCGSHKEEITSLVFTFLESSHAIINTCAKCFLKTAACGSPGTNNENYANNWYIQEKFLLNTLHSFLDSLFESIELHHENHRVYDLREYKPAIPVVIEKSLLGKKQRLATNFQSLAEFLCVHLLASFPASKKILPQSILNVIWKGLSVNCSTLMNINVSSDVTSLLTVISDVNVSCLKILNALIESCRINLLSYSPFICRILSQILIWTNVKNWPYGVGKPHRSIRMEAYICATNWLNVCHACSGINKHMDELLSSVISDINIEPPILTLKVPPSKGKGKKHKQKRDVPVALEHIVNEDEDKDLCRTALDLIPVMLSSVSAVMKPEQHKLLQETIVSKLLQIQDRGSSLIPIPYSSGDCRLGLYKALLALCNNYHPSFPPPINYATMIFSKGMKESSMKVLAFCVHALNNIDKVLKPPCSSLEFSTLDGSSTNFIKEKSKISKSKENETVFSSTPVRSNGDTRHSFQQNLDNSKIDQTSGTTYKQTENFPTNNDDQIHCLGGEKHTETEFLNKEKQISSKKNNNIESEMSLNVSFPENSPPHCPEIDINTVILGKDNYHKIDSFPCSNHNSFDEVTPSTSYQTNQISGREKKRNLEENDVAENTSKKSKVNGINEEQTLTIEDSDDEMLNSFVDDVIDE